MDRRAFISTLAGGLLTAPLAAEAQQTGKVPRVGFLGNSSPELDSEWVTAFRRGLREIGYVEGQNIVIEYRWAEGKRERFADLAAELVRLKVDVIVTGVDRALEAARRSTTTIPIVVATATNPVGLGYVASLSRPGGNITGLSIQTAELPAKRLQLLREAVPKPRLLAALWDPAEPGREGNIREAEAAARSVGVQLRTQRASNPREL